MSDRGLAALYQALNNSSPHLDDETLARIVDAELVGKNIESLFSDQIKHIESCEECALAYCDLMVMTQEAAENMASTAESVSPIEVYTALLEAEIQKRLGELELPRELVSYLATAMARQLKTLPIGKLPTALPAGLIQLSPSAGSLSADTVKTITTVIARNTAALSAFLTGQASLVWGKSFRATAEILESEYFIRLTSPAQIAEPKAVYTAGDERPLTSLDLPDSTVQLNARLYRQTPLTCRLTIQLSGAEGTKPAGRAVHMQYDHTQEMAETDADGMVQFNDIPIAALPDLEIRVG